MDGVRKALSVHALVFCCAVVACLVVGPLLPGARYLIPWLVSERGRVHVELQSPQLRCLSVPVGGRFVAAKALCNGTEVVKGQIMGVVEDTPIPRELADAQRKYADLQLHLLRLEAQRGQGIAGEPGLAAGMVREARDTALKLRDQEREIARLRELEAKLTVTSPISGRVTFGLAASRPVGPHETICSIYPPDRTDLIALLQGPEAVIDGIIKAGRVEVVFSTPEGDVTVTATPLHGSRHGFVVEKGPGKPHELWASVHCVPVDVPPNLLPGTVGRLR